MFSITILLFIILFSIYFTSFFNILPSLLSLTQDHSRTEATTDISNDDSAMVKTQSIPEPPQLDYKITAFSLSPSVFKIESSTATAVVHYRNHGNLKYVVG
jgi:P pilus assembly chaperone PapD